MVSPNRCRCVRGSVPGAGRLARVESVQVAELDFRLFFTLQKENPSLTNIHKFMPDYNEDDMILDAAD